MAHTPAGNRSAELALGADLRQQLGLSRDEKLSVVDTSAHFVMLERTGAAKSFAVPWDRSLVLCADVRSFPLADLISMIHDSGKSGFLAFESEFTPAPAQGSQVSPDPPDSGNRETAIYFRRGEVVFASSSNSADRLGHSLLRSGRITLAELQEVQQVWSPPDRFGKVLVERGLLSPRELWNAVKHQVEEIVRSLFAHTQGQIYFWEGDVEPDNVVRLALPTQRLVAEGLRRRDEIFRFLALLEDRRVTLHALPQEAGRLSGNERALHEELQKNDSFSPACHAVRLDPLTGARVVQLLSLLGAVRIDQAEGDAVPAASEEDSVRELVLHHVKLLAELVSPLVAVDGSARVSERIGAVVVDGADQFPELFSGLAIGAGAVLDPEELVKRSLRLAGDRESQVTQALGELVAYVEFELMNHPDMAKMAVTGHTGSQAAQSMHSSGLIKNMSSSSRV